MSPSAPAIELHGAGRTFGATVALHPLDLSIQPGEIVGLLGPNGSGKTTTLRVLATLIKPTSGSATVLGHDVVAGAMTIRRSLGVMPEKPSLYERLSIRDNLRFWAEAHSVAAPASAIAESLDFVGLAGRDSERVGALSKGWRQRVALARAIVHRPKILLLDEPSSGLDPSAASAMERMIHELVAGGSTVLMNTHRLAEAERLCDRVAILRHGRLLELGTPGQLRDRLLGGVVRVELATPPDTGLRETISAIPGPSRVEWRQRSFSVRLENASAETPRLVARLVHAGADILSVTQAGDLEEAYLELMARTEETECEAAA
ncbi:MAG: ABC transporter ATP-binding protein [Dehalococcoidia bacterium]